MTTRRATILKLVAILVVAPIGAAVIIGALLLFGIRPQIVFMPGLFVMGQLAALGFTVANPVAVVSTAVFWWALILLAWFAAHRWRSGQGPRE